jgi:hypothetical protein
MAASSLLARALTSGEAAEGGAAIAGVGALISAKADCSPASLTAALLALWVDEWCRQGARVAASVAEDSGCALACWHRVHMLKQPCGTTGDKFLYQLPAQRVQCGLAGCGDGTTHQQQSDNLCKQLRIVVSGPSLVPRLESPEGVASSME